MAAAPKKGQFGLGNRSQLGGNGQRKRKELDSLCVVIPQSNYFNQIASSETLKPKVNNIFTIKTQEYVEAKLNNLKRNKTTENCENAFDAEPESEKQSYKDTSLEMQVRHNAMVLKFRNLGSPKENEWKEKGTISIIMKACDVKPNSRTRVMEKMSFYSKRKIIAIKR